MSVDLLRKLQLKPGARALVLHAPAGYLAALAEQLEGVMIADESTGPHDSAIVFVDRLADAVARAEQGIAALRSGGMLWMLYPKGSSKVKTNVNRDTLWETLEETGWQPVRQVSLDAIWSALRFRPQEEVGR
ncbi:MAG: hypothetical protein WCI67_01310 [Chloroflexales bacterium]